MSSQIEGAAIQSNGAAGVLAFENADKSVDPGTLSKTGRRFVEPGAYAQDGTFVFVTNPTVEQLVVTYGLLEREIGSIAPLSVVVRVCARNPLAWWVLWRSADERRIAPEIVGLAAYVPLNETGLTALRGGAFEARDPDLSHVAPKGDDPAGLYLWGLVAHGLSDIVGKLVGHAIGLDLYETLPMIGTIGTQEGLDALKRSTKSALDASALKIGSTFEIRLPPKHVAHQRAMRVWEGDARTARPD